MGFLWHGVLAAALMTTALMGSRLNGSEADLTTAVTIRNDDVRSGAEHFQLSTGDRSCLVTKFDRLDSASARLIAEPACDDVMTGMTTVRSWREMPDGVIVLSDRQGSVLAAFAIADGAGYESFEPRLRPMSLVKAGG
ncbi:MAG TPA: AprI/Inh family metalloprotease inhibitor [Rhizobiaceae bacterium]|nr:AprI/Inh family metalloprotease inhibitor [Rhizobiaceae bacterium]